MNNERRNRNAVFVWHVGTDEPPISDTDLEVFPEDRCWMNFSTFAVNQKPHLRQLNNSHYETIAIILSASSPCDLATLNILDRDCCSRIKDSNR